MRLLKLVVVGLLGLAACGDDTPDPGPAIDRCKADGISGYIEGTIERPDGNIAISLSADELPYGLINDSEFQVQFGDQAVDDQKFPLHLKIVENKDAKNLLDLYANAVEGGPAVLEIFDTTGVDTSASRRSSLDPFDCTIGDGNQCAQLAFDSTGEFIVTDDDYAVYNAKRGTFTIVEFGTPSRLFVQFDIELGPNVLTVDDTSSGRIQGCIDARYSNSNSGIALK